MNEEISEALFEYMGDPETEVVDISLEGEEQSTKSSETGESA